MLSTGTYSSLWANLPKEPSARARSVRRKSPVTGLKVVLTAVWKMGYQKLTYTYLELFFTPVKQPPELWICMRGGTALRWKCTAPNWAPGKPGRTCASSYQPESPCYPVLTRVLEPCLKPKQITLQQKDILYHMASLPLVETDIKRWSRGDCSISTDAWALESMK